MPDVLDNPYRACTRDVLDAWLVFQDAEEALKEVQRIRFEEARLHQIERLLVGYEFGVEQDVKESRGSRKMIEKAAESLRAAVERINKASACLSSETAREVVTRTERLSRSVTSESLGDVLTELAFIKQTFRASV